MINAVVRIAVYRGENNKAPDVDRELP